jgi:hypothetical protein
LGEKRVKRIEIGGRWVYSQQFPGVFLRFKDSNQWEILSSTDGIIKWFDQFIVCQKDFVNRKKRGKRKSFALFA